MDKGLENVLNASGKILVELDKENLTDLEKIAALKSASGLLENVLQMKGAALMYNKMFDNMGGGKI